MIRKTNHSTDFGAMQQDWSISITEIKTKAREGKKTKQEICQVVKIRHPFCFSKKNRMTKKTTYGI